MKLRRFFLLTASILLTSCGTSQKRVVWEPDLYMFEVDGAHHVLEPTPRLRRCAVRSRETDRCYEWTYLKADEYYRGYFIREEDIKDLAIILRRMSQTTATISVGGQ